MKIILAAVFTADLAILFTASSYFLAATNSPYFPPADLYQQSKSDLSPAQTRNLPGHVAAGSITLGLWALFSVPFWMYFTYLVIRSMSWFDSPPEMVGKRPVAKAYAPKQRKDFAPSSFSIWISMILTWTKGCVAAALLWSAMMMAQATDAAVEKAKFGASLTKMDNIQRVSDSLYTLFTLGILELAMVWWEQNIAFYLLGQDSKQ